MAKLGVNVDHVATIRQARRAEYPDPADAARAAERAGADAITVHLREDRRHIQDGDLLRIRDAIGIHLNQELAPIHEMVEIAALLKPNEVCFVPERREEVTTEGGLDAAGMRERLSPLVERMKLLEIGVSLFLDPEPHQIEAAARLGADFVELHTGIYANLADADLAAASRAAASTRRGPRGKIRDGNPGVAGALSQATLAELKKLRAAVKTARALGLKVNAGHGLNYRNVEPVARIPGLKWLHIGHSIVARAVMVGMERAVREMIALTASRSAASRASVRGRVVRK